MNKFYGIVIMLLAFIYNVVATHHYGNHFTPTCDGEVMADGITCIITAIGVLAFSRK